MSQRTRRIYLRLLKGWADVDDDIERRHYRLFIFTLGNFKKRLRGEMPRQQKRHLLRRKEEEAAY